MSEVVRCKVLEVGTFRGKHVVKIQLGASRTKRAIVASPAMTMIAAQYLYAVVDALIENFGDVKSARLVGLTEAA